MGLPSGRASSYPLGFSKRYNFVLFSIFGGLFLLFVLSRSHFLHFDKHFCPPVPSPHGATGTPGTCYWMQIPRYRAGMILHLATVLPAGFLAVFQFVPSIRSRFPQYHRVAGYVSTALILAGNVGAVAIADRAMGGDIGTQTLAGCTALLTTASLGRAIMLARQRRIAEHRAWMLRSWVYHAFIVSLRVLQVAMALVISMWDRAAQYVVMPCDEMAFVYGNDAQLHAKFPGCAPGNERFAAGGYVAVRATMDGDRAEGEAAVHATFAVAGWLALMLHAIGIELYLWLTSGSVEKARQARERPSAEESVGRLDKKL